MFHSSTRAVATAAVVEDDNFVAATIVARLARLEVDASVFPDLHTARQEFKSRHFDFAIFDVNLPDGSGIDLIKEIRAGENNSEIPVIIATSNSDERLVMEAYSDSGVMLVSHKPIEWRCLEYVLEQTVIKEAASATCAG